MKSFVLLWLTGLAVIGFVGTFYPPTDTNVYPTIYKTILRPVQGTTTTVPAEGPVVDPEAILSRLQEIEDGQERLSSADKALRVYVDVKDDSANAWRRGYNQSIYVLLGAFILAWAIGAAALIRSFRKGGQK